VAGAKVTGAVHGGQNPISGAHVYLLAAASGASGAGMAAYGGSGIAASASNASVSLLTSGSGQDGTGNYYVATGSDGSFSISGDYTCAAGQQVYLYSVGGDPGLGTRVNLAAGLMAALGSCPALGTFPSGMFVIVNEVSTVAAAYAMAGFATDATHVGSSGTALALTGIANAFANAGNLETLGTGVALAVTPAGNGTVPQAEINTLANILAECVNSNGAGTACATLFANAESGGTTGTVATDTATAAINIAHNPAVGVAALYGLSTANPPFGGGLTAQPNDWTVEISFSGGGLSLSFGTLAIDGSGNVWVAELGANGAIELSSSGAVQSGTGGYLWSGSVGHADRVAIDPSGNAWLTGGGTHYLIEVSNTGTYLGSRDFAYSGGPSSMMGGANGVVVDGAGNVWVPTYVGLTEVSNNGLLIGWIGGTPQWGLITGYYSAAADSSGNIWVTPESSLYPGGTNFIGEFSTAANGGSGGFLFPNGGGGFNEPEAMAIDGSGNGWFANSVGDSISKVSSAGVALSPSSGFTGGGLVLPYCLSMDGAGNVWVGGNTSKNIVEFSNVGSVLSGTNGYRTGESALFSIAVDGSGNIWTANGSVNEILGAATPMVTPLSVGAKNNMLGTRP
jgi:hypothetical protein